MNKDMEAGIEPNPTKLSDNQLNNKNNKQTANEEVSESHEWKKYLQIFVAEIVATALLMCLGCMGCVEGFNGPNQTIHQMQPAFVFGFVVAALITAFGHISGCHMNPAVTVCFYLIGTINLLMVPIYFIAEIIGALLGVGMFLFLTPSDVLGTEPVCTTVPDGAINSLQAVTIEFLITSLLLFVLLSCSDPRNELKQDSVPLKFGATIITCSLLAGPYTGASLNPVRSFAPALWFKEWTGHWVYWVGPLASGLVTPLFYQTCFADKSK